MGGVQPVDDRAGDRLAQQVAVCTNPEAVRLAGIVRLLETRDDHLPVPSRRSPIAAGFSHEARSRTCPDCLANDRVSPTCETCFGRGVVDPRYAPIAATDELPDDGERRDPYSVNASTKPYGLDGSRHDAAYARDREIEELARQTRPAPTEAELLAEANQRGYGWEEARRAMYRRYDYLALDRALDELRVRDDGAYHALHLVYVYGVLEPSATLETACVRGLDFLDASLPDPLRAPGAPGHPAQDRQSRRRRAA